jgi:hypothetical protein
LVVLTAEAGAITDQAAGQGVITVWEDRGQRMPGRQRRELFGPPRVESTAAYQYCTNALLRKTGEGCFEIAVGFRIHNNKLQAQPARRHLQVCDDGWGARKGWVRENANRASAGCQLAEQLQLFGRQLGRQTGTARDIRARPVKAGDKTQYDRVTASTKNNGYGRGRCLRHDRCTGAGSYDYRDAAADEIGCEYRQPIVLVLRKSILDHHVLALDIAGFLQTLEDRNGDDL